MSRTSGAAPELGGRRPRRAERVRRRASRATRRELRRALPVSGVGDEEGSLEHAPQVCDRRPGGRLPRAPVPIELCAAQRGQRDAARIPTGPRSIRSIPSSINAGRPASGAAPGPVPRRVGGVGLRTEWRAHDPAERGVERPAGPERRGACPATAHAATGSPREAASSASAPGAPAGTSGPAHAVHQRTGGCG